MVVMHVDDISSYGTIIEISRVPFEVSNEMLASMMQKYGEVHKCKYHFRQFGDYRSCKNSGDRRVWMKLNQNIPQCITIKQTQTTIEVRHQNQQMTCNKC